MIGLAGWSGSGKTTLITKVLPTLIGRGLRVSTLKHAHHGFETAIYCLSGRVETRYGPGLRQSVVCEAGDFLFIAPDVPHQPINLSATEPAMAIVARNDPSEHETVVPYDPADE